MHNKIFGLPGILGSFFEARSRFGLVEWFIKFYKPAMIIIADDKVRYDSLILLKIAPKLKIPIVNVPSVISHPEEEAEVYKHNKQLTPTGVKLFLVRLFFPRWIVRYQGFNILRIKLSEILAMELLGIAPKTPWIDNNGDVDAIAVESRAMFRLNLKIGVKRSKMKLIGSVAEDIMINNLEDLHLKKNNLYHRLKLNPSLPIIVVAIPVDMMYMPGGRPECDFKTYQELLIFFLDSLEIIKNYNIVASLHPSVETKEMKYIEKWGIKVARENAVDLIPFADFFVASVSSSIRWAILCGKPVLDYDVYRYGYHNYDSAPGVVGVTGQRDFQREIQKFSQDKEYLEDLRKKQKKCSREWGMLDGKCGERIVNLIDNLLDNSKR